LKKLMETASWLHLVQQVNRYATSNIHLLKNNSSPNTATNNTRFDTRVGELDIYCFTHHAIMCEGKYPAIILEY